MFKLLPKSRYPTGMLYCLTERTLTIYVQDIKGFKRQTSYLLEKLFAKDLVHFFQTAFLNASNWTTHLQRLFRTKI